MTPRQTLPVLALTLGAAASALAGTITGTVTAQGPDTGPTAAGRYGSRTLRLAEKTDYEAFTDFVVYINQEVPGAPTVPATAEVQQKGATFIPYVLPIAVGTTVSWPNLDSIFHNVYSPADSPQGFDLGLYEGGDDPPQHRFDQVGRVDVFCAIHSRMHCIVLVVPNAFFARVDSRGRFTIPNVPPGTYRLRAWHDRLPPKEIEIVVPEQGEVTSDFVLSPGGVAAPN